MRTRPGDAEQAATFARLRGQMMTEVIRSFPGMDITGKELGIEAEALFLKIRDELNKAGRGKLSTTVHDPDAVIYINEGVRGRSKVDVGDVVPGSYRILVQMSVGEARKYTVEVAANQLARLATRRSAASPPACRPPGSTGKLGRYENHRPSPNH